MQEKKARETRQIRNIALGAFLLNLLLAGTKGTVAVFSGSLAVVAGTIDSVTDSIASLAVYFGVVLSTRKTRTFPLGLYKIENLISVAVAFFIFIAGYEIAKQAFLGKESPPVFSLWVVLVLLGATLATFLFGRFALYRGRQTGSPTLIAEGKHRQADVLANLVVLLAATLQYFGLRFSLAGISLDQIAAVLVLLFILRTGWELLSDGMRVLLDASLDHQTLKEIKEIIESEPTVAKVNSVVGRNAGRFRFIQADVALRTGDLKKGHDASDQIETRIQDQIPNVERVMIHYEPYTPDELRVAVPLENPRGTVSEHFGEAPYFCICSVSVGDHRFLGRETVANRFANQKRGKGIRVAEWLVSLNVDVLLLKEDIRSKGPGYVLSDAGVRIHVLDSEHLHDLLQEYACVCQQDREPGRTSHNRQAPGVTKD